jgi:hypothetical protein
MFIPGLHGRLLEKVAKSNKNVKNARKKVTSPLKSRKNLFQKGRNSEKSQNFK